MIFLIGCFIFSLLLELRNEKDWNPPKRWWIAYTLFDLYCFRNKDIYHPPFMLLDLLKYKHTSINVLWIKAMFVCARACVCMPTHVLVSGCNRLEKRAWGFHLNVCSSERGHSAWEEERMCELNEFSKRRGLGIKMTMQIQTSQELFQLIFWCKSLILCLIQTYLYLHG